MNDTVAWLRRFRDDTNMPPHSRNIADRGILEIERLTELGFMALIAKAREGSNRAQDAYNTFRSGFRDGVKTAPPWEDLEHWMRDMVRVAYLQGLLDQKSRQ